MAEDIKKKKNPADAVMQGMYNAFPSDEDLQNTKAERRGWIQKLREKGLPDMIAKGADYVSDAITPDTREEYMQQLGTSVGSVGKPVAGFMAAARPEASAVAKQAVSQEGQSALRKLAREMPSAKSAFVEGSEDALGGMVDDLAAKGTYVKPGELNRAYEINKINKTKVKPTTSEGQALRYDEINKMPEAPAIDASTYKKAGPGDITPGVKDLQRDMMVANEMGDYKKAKEILEQIRTLRGGK